MNISEMIDAIKNGKKVKRECWQNCFLYYVPFASYAAMTDVTKSLMNADGNVAYKEYIAEFDTVSKTIQMYNPSQSDLFANDWEVVR